jgi:hypothetical protein
MTDGIGVNMQRFKWFIRLVLNLAPRHDLIWKQILFRERNRSIGERDSADANVHGVASVFFDIFARALWARRPAENDGASPRKELAMAGKTSP